MRILSQDGLHEGMMDVPYEQVSIEQRKNEIWCGYSFAMQGRCVGKCFARYSTEAKAGRVLQQLHDVYLSRMELEGGYCEAQGFYDQPDFWVLPRVFQFPQDGEVEVGELQK